MWPNPQEIVDFVTLAERIHITFFVCGVWFKWYYEGLFRAFMFFFEWAKKFFLKKEQNHKFLNKSPRSDGEVAKFSENDLLYDIN